MIFNDKSNELHEYIINVAQIATRFSLTACEIECASCVDDELVNLLQCISNAKWSE